MVEKSVVLSGGKLPYFELGYGPKLLFLHGGIASPGAYAAFLNLLAEKFSVIAPTLPGHGKSFAISPDWSVEDYIATLDEFCQKTGNNPEILIGHSLGGMLALYLASLNHGKKVLVFDPTGLPIPMKAAFYIQALFGEAKAAIKARPDLTYIKNTLPTAGTLVHTLVRHRGDIPWFYAKAPNIDISNRFSSIKIPTYLFWGENDQIVPLKLGKIMHKLISSSKLTIFPNFGHAYIVTNPEYTFDNIKKFI